MSTRRARLSSSPRGAGALPAAVPVFRMRILKRVLLALLLALACAALAACTTLNALVDAEPAASTGTGPNLGLLSLPAYTDAEADTPEATASGSGYANVDFWLDGTQNMGGISTVANSLYPHYGRKYREGGFHYHYGANAGWYESLLRDFLAAAGETHVRTLRYGNETMPNSTAAAYGLARADGTLSASVWRDLHTVAVDTQAGLFATFSDEDMSQSFYALGSSAWVNRVSAVETLENPALADAMSAALDAQIAGIAAGDESYILQQGRDGQQCALLSALANLDVDKLSIITVDPASVRKTTGADAQGQPLSYYEQLLASMGVFDRGLCVGVLDFQLDYMGQLTSFSTADFGEPLIWGRVILDEKKQTFENLGVMPWRMLTLVVGKRARVDGFIDSLSQIIESDRSLAGLRGPENGELTYTADGQTVTQQPFGFEWSHTVIARPSMGYYTQHTDGAAFSAAAENDATQAVTTGENDVPLVTLAADNSNADYTFTVRFPLSSDADGAALDVNNLSGAGIETLDTLLLTRSLANTPENRSAAEQARQTAIPYRDQLYLFGSGADDGVFTLVSITQRDGELVCTLSVNGGRLKPGYYRLRLTADATADQVAWESVPWVDGPDSVNAAVTDADVYEWETFVATVVEYDGNSSGIPSLLKHAWGSYTDKLYHNLRVPD
ncbi:MAG: hypothetical protein PHY64_02305, partial [Eubacteriales bacterium]|nr:hypothetical protein [Eubacteriales bacterium]